jgi:hypothetical protein
MPRMDDMRFAGVPCSQRFPASAMRPEDRSSAKSLNAVADPELREIMEIVLEEDADLIRYLADR